MVDELPGLSIVNACLRLMGETALASEQEYHEYLGNIQALYSKVSRDLQVRGWWFNTEERTLEPQTDGIIAVPNDVLSVIPTRQVPGAFAVRGQALYDTGAGTNVFTTSQRVRLVLNVPLEDLPYSAFSYVREQTVFRFATDFEADNAKIQNAERAAKQAYGEMHAEHIRATRANAADSVYAIQRLRGMRGYTTIGSIV